MTKLSDTFIPELRAVIDAAEAQLVRLPARPWNEWVVYVTDMTPEFEAHEWHTSCHVEILRREEAVSREQERGSATSRRTIIEALQRPQNVNYTWLVACGPKGETQMAEVVIVPLSAQVPGVQ